jgi:hypothetical protein
MRFVVPREFLFQLSRIWSVEFDTEGEFRLGDLFEYRFIELEPALDGQENVQ